MSEGHECVLKMMGFGFTGSYEPIKSPPRAKFWSKRVCKVAPWRHKGLLLRDKTGSLGLYTRNTTCIRSHKIIRSYRIIQMVIEIMIGQS